MSNRERLRLGLSACLLGQRVRHDGGHKRDEFLSDILSRYVEWVAICPEVEIGMGTPREPVRLEADGTVIKMVGVSSRRDWTEKMQDFSHSSAKHFIDQRISGFVFKSRSPSCGLHGIGVVGQSEPGRGLFAAGIKAHLPLLPTEEESGLAEPAKRERFIERIFAYRRLEEFFRKERTPGQVAMFNAQHSLQLKVHSVSGQEELSRLVSEAKDIPWSRLRESYRAAFMRVLDQPASVERNQETLIHVSSRLSRVISAKELKEVQEVIDAYGQGTLPLAVPLNLLSDHVRTSHSPALEGQTYLEPYPHELMMLDQP